MRPFLIPIHIHLLGADSHTAKTSFSSLIRVSDLPCCRDVNLRIPPPLWGYHYQYILGEVNNQLES